MSIKVMTWAWEQPFSGNDKLVLLSLADSANEDGRNAWPSVATIARKTSASVRTVQRVLRSLEATGVIAIEVQSGGTVDMRPDQRPNRYTIRLDWTPRQNDTPRRSVTPPVTRVSPAPPSFATERGDTGVTQTVLEPSVEPSVVAPSAPQPQEATAKDRARLITMGFLERYRTYRFEVVHGIVKRYLSDGRQEAVIVAGLRALGEQDKPVTLDTLRIEMGGGFKREAREPVLQPSVYDKSPASRGLDEVLW